MAAVYKSLAKRASRSDDRNEGFGDMDQDVIMEDGEEDSDETSDSEEDDEVDRNGFQDTGSSTQKGPQSGAFMPKTRVLMLTSRGVTHRHRHLLADLASLLPHAHKETKLDSKKKTAGYNALLNSLADLHSCNVIFFLEARKHGQDLYLWLARPPNGPTIKFAVNNLHTMGELGAGFSGNCLKGGRGVVVFDPSFDDQLVMKHGNEWKGLVREMMRSVFSVPKRGVRGMKPFVDRIIGIFGVDGKIWVRVFEIRETDQGTTKSDNTKEGNEPSARKKKGNSSKDGQPEVSLVEIGPRFVLTPIVILEGSFGGPVIYENKEYVSPNQVRREIRMKKAGRYASRRAGQMDSTVRKSELGLRTESGEGVRKKDQLDSRVLFA